jgi:hypothetical protein
LALPEVANSTKNEGVGATPARRAWRWLVRDRRTGRTTLVQLPNPPLAVFLTSRLVLAVARPPARVDDLVSVVGTVGLLWWSIDEIARGVNPFRRLLGATVLASLAYRLAR